jgi:GH15 family glucan-1,4-alpha-glucosidase
MNTVYESSIKIIKKNQSSSGAYIASPNFPTYRYCWFRDGAFIAYSMDLAGEHQSSQLFHNWATRTVLKYKTKITKCIEQVHKGNHLDDMDYFHSRFTVDGSELSDDWGHNQLDGLGTWLWAFVQHLSLTKQVEISLECIEATQLIRDYLIGLWKYPCFDCWEEKPDRIHTYTLASIFGGLNNLACFFKDDIAKQAADEIRSFVLQNLVQNDYFIKHMGSSEIDANLLGLALPYEIIDMNDENMKRTIDLIEKQLQPSSIGVHRYPSDSYYGGGSWVLLTAWLGWYYSKTGRNTHARQILDWIEHQTTKNGELPEQVKEDLLVPSKYNEWVNRWGDIASPLLWSHSMYLILYKALGN